MPGSKPVFPLIRHISGLFSPMLIRMPFSANMVTSASLLSGLAACWYLAQGSYADTLIGAALFLVCYILDNCDGEVARAKNQSSTFGHHYDTFVDWLVHSAFFACLGWGTMRQSGADYWLWLGLFGALGGTINYFIGLYIDFRQGDGGGGESSDESADTAPQTVMEWLAFALRELSRADFWCIVLVLALFDWTWFLLPTAAVGAHVYWMAIFIEGARGRHV